MPDFKYINNEKVDLSRQDHRDVIIQRNKALDLAVKDGLDLKHVRVSVEITVEMDCLKCGNWVRNWNDEVLDDHEYAEFEIDRNLPIAKCSECDTKYIYDRSEDNFTVILKKSDLKPIKPKADAKF